MTPPGKTWAPGKKRAFACLFTMSTSNPDVLAFDGLVTKTVEARRREEEELMEGREEKRREREREREERKRGREVRFGHSQREIIPVFFIFIFRSKSFLVSSSFLLFFLPII